MKMCSEETIREGWINIYNYFAVLLLFGRKCTPHKDSFDRKGKYTNKALEGG